MSKLQLKQEYAALNRNIKAVREDLWNNVYSAEERADLRDTITMMYSRQREIMVAYNG